MESKEDFLLKQAAVSQERARKVIARINQPNKMKKFRRFLRFIGLKIKEPNGV